MFKTAIALAIGLAALPTFAAFEPLTDSGTPVLRQCTGIPDPVTGIPPTPTQCEVATTPVPDTTLNGAANGSAFPGQTGNWALVGARTGVAISANGSQIGTLEERVWKQIGSTNHIFGTKVSLSDSFWTEPANDNMGLAGTNGCDSQAAQRYEVNDVFRTGFTGKTGLTVAFRESTTTPAEEGLFLAGRTQQGLAILGSGGTGSAVRDNAWVNFRTDANFDDPDATDAANTKWLYVRTTSTKTAWSATASTIRIEEGGEEGQCKYRITLSGFRP